MEVKKDCFAYNSDKKCCEALKELYCKNENCKFYKSNEELSWKYIETCCKKYTKEYREKHGGE